MSMKKLLAEIKEGMNDFGDVLSTLINTILLSLVYIIGVGITSLFAKLFNKHFIEYNLSGNSTYWSDLNLKRKKIEDYYRQF